jgi:hypothetical protein
MVRVGEGEVKKAKEWNEMKVGGGNGKIRK